MASPWKGSAYPTPEASRSALPASARLPGSEAVPGLPARAPLTFRRTVRGDAQVRDPEHPLPLHISRLLMLFEGPQTVHDLRRMIDEPWLPEALIELQRRRLIERLDGTMSAATASPIGAASVAAKRAATARTPTLPVIALNQQPAARRQPAAPLPPAAPRPTTVAKQAPIPANTPLAAQRDWVRVMFLRHLGALGSDMGRRIDQCRNLDELDELMPQVEALVEAIAGREALARFREQTVRDH